MATTDEDKPKIYVGKDAEKDVLDLFKEEFNRVYNTAISDAIKLFNEINSIKIKTNDAIRILEQLKKEGVT